MKRYESKRRRDEYLRRVRVCGEIGAVLERRNVKRFEREEGEGD